MDATRQTLFAGGLQAEYERELSVIRSESLLGRLWAQDVTLWPSGEAGTQHLKSNLEFLHIPEKLLQLVAGALQTNSETLSQSLTHRILIVFGSVYHFCEALLNVQPDIKGQKCIILDSCHPNSIRDVESQVEPRKTLVVLVNKSAYRLEDHALFLYFQKRLREELAGSSAGHFVAASQKNTLLASAASQYDFRYLLELPPGILAPYCSVIHLGVLLPALAGVEIEALRIACREMKKRYADASTSVENPVCEIASLLSATSKSGRPFLTFIAPPSLAPFASALCRLVGGSIGKSRGLFPLAITAPCVTEPFESVSSFVILKNSAEEAPHLAQCCVDLKGRRVPFLELVVADPLDLLRHTFCWQMATVLAAARMGIDPFDSGDVRLPRTLAAEMINGLSAGKATLQRRPRIQEKEIQLFAEARARQEVSQLNLTECLASFFEHRGRASYLGLFVFLGQTQETQTQLGALRDELSRSLGLPVLLAWGARSMETYGYFLRDGAAQGFVLVVTGDSQFDIKIPGAAYSFGQLYRVLTLAQFEAMSEKSGLALRLHLCSQTPESLLELRNIVTQALRRVGRLT